MAYALRSSDWSSDVCSSDLVDLVGGARDRLGLDVEAARLEEAQALQTHLGAVDRHLRIPRALELAHLAAHDLVGGAGGALAHDAPPVDARARHHLPLDRDGAGLPAAFRDRVTLWRTVAHVSP